jgi:hypothetical protein
LSASSTGQWGTPAGQISALTDAATTRLDKVAGTKPGNRPAHLAQLAIVLAAAVHQARQVSGDPAKVERDAELWKLREPGFLRGIADHPVARAGNAIVLFPVVLTWAVLGAAEWMYVQEYTAFAAADRPPFFADWLTQPVWRGPFALSAVIVATVLLIMNGYRRPAREQKIADETDRIVHRLEVDLLPPVTILRSQLGPVDDADATRRAAADLADAARRFGLATDRLAESMAVVDRLGGVVDRMAAAVPDLQIQVSRLADLDTRLGQSVAEIAQHSEPLTTAVAAVTGAAEAASGTIARSEAALREAGTRLDGADALATRTAEHQATLAQAQQPFTAAADSVAAAAGKLDSTVAAVHATATQLREVIRDVNWLTTVSDGLRNGESDHRVHE